MLKNFRRIFLFLFLFIFFNISLSVKAIEKAAVQVVDTGQSDCILILDGSKTIMIDTGDEKSKEKIYKHLSGEGIKELEYIILSHYHEDHFGNLINLCKDFKVKNVLLPKYALDVEARNHIINKLNELNINIGIGSDGWSYKSDNVDLKAFGSTKCDEKNENNNSIIIYGTIDGLKYSFMGDAEAKLEKQYVSKKIMKDLDVLKVSHHGLETSSSKSFLKYVKPKVALITSDGKESPNDSVIKNLDKYKTIILRTDEMNNIMIMSHIDEAGEKYIRIYNKK